MHCMTSDLWKTGAKNSVTNVNSLTQLYPILRINSIICYQSSRYNLQTSVTLSLGKCALVVTRPHLFHPSPIGRTFIGSFFFFYSLFILQEIVFEWQSIKYKLKQLFANFMRRIWIFFNKQTIYLEEMTAQRKNQIAERAGTNLGRINSWNSRHPHRVRTPEKCSPRIYLPFSRQSSRATARGLISLVWQLL